MLSNMRDEQFILLVGWGSFKKQLRITVSSKSYLLSVPSFWLGTIPLPISTEAKLVDFCVKF